MINKILASNNHEIKGVWRYVFLVALFSIPLVVFIVMMWFQINNCSAQSTFYFFASSQMIQQFLGQNNIHYCASVYYDSGKYYTCNFGPPNPTTFDFSGPCSVFQSEFDTPYSGLKSCLSTSEMFQVFYYQCIPVQSAIVNSVQYALYTVITVVYLYLLLRISVEFGIFGLFSSDNWAKLLGNKKNINKTDIA